MKTVGVIIAISPFVIYDIVDGYWVLRRIQIPLGLALVLASLYFIGIYIISKAARNSWHHSDRY